MAATESTIRFSGHTLDKATKAKVNKASINFFPSPGRIMQIKFLIKAHGREINLLT